MSYKTFFLVLTLCGSAAPCAQSAPGPLFNVRDFGAVGDGKTVETPALTRALRACAQAGGGTVDLPAGEYVTGTLELLSKVTLNLQSGARLIGSKELSDYACKTNFLAQGGSGQCGEGLKAGLLIARNAEDIAITGHGVIDGRGTFFVDVNQPHYGEPPNFDKRYTRQGDEFMSLKHGTSDGPVRPWMPWNDRPGPLIILSCCTNVQVRDLTLKDSHNWTLTIAGCERVSISGLEVLNNLLIPNNDGINIHARNARISDCNIAAGDDGIAANGCENLAVVNCTIVSRSSGIRFTGGRDCTFQNLIVRDSNRGIGVYGSAQSVLFSDIIIQTRLHTGHWWGKAEPIHISVGPGRTGSRKGAIKDVRFSNILADSESGILVYGTEPGVIQGLAFSQLKLRLKGGAASDAVGGNFDLRGVGTGLETAIFKHDIPAMYCQYVDGLEIHGFEIEWAGNVPGYFSDGIHCEHVNNLTVDGFVGRQAQVGAGAGAAVVLKHGRRVSLRDCIAAESTGTFLSLEDVEGREMFVNNDLAHAKQAAEPANLDFKTCSGNLQPQAQP